MMSENRNDRYETEGAFTFARRGGVRYLRCHALEACGSMTHAFCTRWGGVSQGKLANFNFGTHVGDSDETVAHNTEILRSAFDLPGDNPVTVSQVHGDRLLVIDKTPQDIRNITTLEYDGIITALHGIAVGIKTADCVPLLIADRMRGVIGAIHAGWEGTARGIAAKAIDLLIRAFASAPEDIIVAIGPAIGPCCYEVDDPVFHSFDNTRAQRYALTRRKREGRWMLDLAVANRSQLQGMGIPEQNILTADICTACRYDTFFSHRAEAGYTGRQISFIMLR